MTPSATSPAPSPPVPPPAELLETTLAAADAAAEIHRKYRGTVRMSEAIGKGRADFVSKVDFEAQEAALGVIRGRYPEHAILAEEGEAGALNEGSRGTPAIPLWIVDPLDGTTNFLHGHPAFASSVGVAVDGVPMAGAVVASATGERWWASRGGGAYRNGERIRTSPLRDFGTALVGTGFPFKHPEQLPRYLEEFTRVLSSTAGIRRWGSAAIDLCYLAQGSLDAFWEGTLAPWDVAAGIMILEEAGGVAARRGGGALRVDAPGPVLAANSPQLLAGLREVVEG